MEGAGSEEKRGAVRMRGGRGKDERGGVRGGEGRVQGRGGVRIRRGAGQNEERGGSG